MGTLVHAGDPTIWCDVIKLEKGKGSLLDGVPPSAVSRASDFGLLGGPYKIKTLNFFTFNKLLSFIFTHISTHTCEINTILSRKLSTCKQISQWALPRWKFSFFFVIYLYEDILPSIFIISSLIKLLLLFIIKKRDMISYGFSMKLFPAGSSRINVKADSPVAQARSFTRNWSIASAVSGATF